VLAGQRLPAQVRKAAPETLGHRAQVPEEYLTLRTVHDRNGGKGSGGLRGCDGVRVDVEGRRLAQEPDDRVTADDISAVDAERPTERCHEQVGATAAGDLLGAPTSWSGRADAVRVVDDQKDILGKGRVEPIDDLGMCASGA
jgi:hypothetical protein